jgi:hypothetical protein
MSKPKNTTNFETRAKTMHSPNALSIKNKDGTRSTHKMAYGSTDRGYIAYPTIVEKTKGRLTELPPDKAARYAIDTGEYKAFAPRPKGKASESAQARASKYAGGGYKPAVDANGYDTTGRRVTRKKP